jgi:CubicO group peptidase (beta-lactamase class C family)
MRRYFTKTLAILAALTCGAAQAGDLDAVLAKALKDHTIPAMAVLVIRDGRIDQQAVRGVRAADSADPARLNDVWHIGSDAKAMTATLIARLVERGTLAWNTPLKSLLPDIPMRSEYQDVTLVELLSHRSGLPTDIDVKLVDAFAKDKRALPAQRQALARVALNDAPVASARADANYSNSGFIIAAAIAEKATGKSYETLMQQEVFHPLGMTVDFSPSRRGQILGHSAGKPLTGPAADNPLVYAPAGAIKLTMHDWALFAIDQMAGEHGQGKLLKQETYVFLHTPQGDTPAALGWGVKKNFPPAAPMRLLIHAGSNGYWNAVIALAPDIQSGVLVAANAGEGTDAEKREKEIVMTEVTAFAKTP